MKRIVIAGVLLASSILCHSQDNVGQAKELLNGGCKGEMIQVDALSRYFVAKLTPNERAQLTASLEKEYTSFSTQAYKKALKRYNLEKINANVAKVAAEANKVKWELIGDVGNSVKYVPMKQGKLLMQTAAFVGKKTMEYGLDYIKSQVDDARRKSLDGLLYNLRKEHRDYMTKVEKAKYLTDDQFLDLVFKSTEANQEFYDQLQPDDRSSFVKYMNDELRDAIHRSEVRSLGRDRRMARNLAENANIIRKVEAGIKKDVQQTVDNLNELKESQDIIREQLAVLTEEHALNSRDMQFVKEFLYGKMDSNEKLGAIDEGMLNHLPIEEKEKEIAKLKLIAAREQFVQTSKKYLNDAQNVLSIAQNLGLKHDFLEKAQKGVDILNGGVAVITQFHSGDILGGMATLTGIFGSKSDPVQAKLQMITDQLNGIMEAQMVLSAQVEQVQKGINHLVAGQEILLKNLQTFAENVNEGLNTIFGKINKVHIDVLINRSLIHEYLSERDFDAITSFIKHEKYSLNVLKENDPDFITITEKILKPHISQLKDFETSVYKAFRVNRKQEKAELDKSGKLFEIPSEFKLISSGSQDDPLLVRNEKFVHDLLRLDSLFTSYARTKPNASPAEMYIGLIMPMYNVMDLMKKNSISLTQKIASDEQVQEIVNFLHCDMTYPYKSSTNNNYLEPTYLLEVVDAMINFHYLYRYLDERVERRINVEEIVKGESAYPSKDFLLYRARFLINIGIAQQIMLSGDVLIPYMYEMLNKGVALPPDSLDTDTSRIQRLCIRILGSNDLVRYNFIKYFVNMRLRELRRPDLNYSLGLRDTDLKFMKNVLLVEDSVDWVNPNGVKQLEVRYLSLADSTERRIWSYAIPSELGKRYFPLPSASDSLDCRLLTELRQGSLAYTNALTPLLEYKDYLDAEIARMEYYKKASVQEKIALNKLLFYHQLSEFKPEK